MSQKDVLVEQVGTFLAFPAEEIRKDFQILIKEVIKLKGEQHNSQILPLEKIKKSWEKIAKLMATF